MLPMFTGGSFLFFLATCLVFFFHDFRNFSVILWKNSRLDQTIIKKNNIWSWWCCCSLVDWLVCSEDEVAPHRTAVWRNCRAGGLRSALHQLRPLGYQFSAKEILFPCCWQTLKSRINSCSHQFLSYSFPPALDVVARFLHGGFLKMFILFFFLPVHSNRVASNGAEGIGVDTLSCSLTWLTLMRNVDFFQRKLPWGLSRWRGNGGGATGHPSLGRSEVGGGRGGGTADDRLDYRFCWYPISRKKKNVPAIKVSDD